MAEKYGFAALRHLRVGSRLLEQSEFDDAGYHFGVSGENSLKEALVICGLALKWKDTIKKKDSPMSAHLPKITILIHALRDEIAVSAVGRRGAAISAVVLDDDFPNRFLRWSIDIRYADDECTPVSEEDCRKWELDAPILLKNL